MLILKWYWKVNAEESGNENRCIAFPFSYFVFLVEETEEGRPRIIMNDPTIK